MNGIRIAKRMRADDALRSVPIILLTASSGEDVAMGARETGIGAYLKKPFDPDVLLEKVRELVGKREA